MWFVVCQKIHKSIFSALSLEKGVLSVFCFSSETNFFRLFSIIILVGTLISEFPNPRRMENVLILLCDISYKLFNQNNCSVYRNGKSCWQQLFVVDEKRVTFVFCWKYSIVSENFIKLKWHIVKHIDILWIKSTRTTFVL